MKLVGNPKWCRARKQITLYIPSYFVTKKINSGTQFYQVKQFRFQHIAECLANNILFWLQTMEDIFSPDIMYTLTSYVLPENQQ